MRGAIPWPLLVSVALCATLCGCQRSAQPVVAPLPEDASDDMSSLASERADEDAAPGPPGAADLARFTADLPGEGQLRVALITSLGTITCALHEDTAPITVANFVGLGRGLKRWVDPETQSLITDQPFYEGVIFHRVIPGFMIQTGDRTGTGAHGPGYTLRDEPQSQRRHDKPGVLSMANAGPDTGGSQLFITERAAPHLDGHHVIFGQCEDLPVIQAIARLPTDSADKPREPATLKRVVFWRGDAKPPL